MCIFECVRMDGWMALCSSHSFSIGYIEYTRDINFFPLNSYALIQSKSLWYVIMPCAQIWFLPRKNGKPNRTEQNENELNTSNNSNNNRIIVCAAHFHNRFQCVYLQPLNCGLYRDHSLLSMKIFMLLFFSRRESVKCGQKFIVNNQLKSLPLCWIRMC